MNIVDSCTVSPSCTPSPTMDFSLAAVKIIAATIALLGNISRLYWKQNKLMLVIATLTYN